MEGSARHPVGTLFGHLVGRFAAHPENLATEALAYILSASNTAKTAFIDLLRSIARELPTGLTFQIQTAGKAGDIPDLVGIDEAGHELVVGEAKFWAGLTDNQPVAYLNRLPEGSTALLLFLAPQKRAWTLWPELMRRCTEAGLTPVRDELTGEVRHAEFRGGRRLGLASWGTVIALLDTRLAANGEEGVRADLHQLRGLCDRMDSEAFLPIRSEEIGPDIPRRMEQFCDLVEDVVSLLHDQRVVDKKNLKPSGSRLGYRRYVFIRGNGCYVGMHWRSWATQAETPFWLGVLDHNWRSTPQLRKTLASLEQQHPPKLVVGPDDEFLVPLFTPIGQERDTTILALAEQVRAVAQLLPDHTTEAAAVPAPEAD